MTKRGFTIVELLFALGIIAVLMTITVVSVSGSVKAARARRASTLCTLAQQGLETYYAQKGQWPWGEKQATLSDGTYSLTAGEVKDAFLKIVREAKEKHNPMMDISGLVVSDHPGEPKTRYTAMDFMDAVRGTKAHPKKIPASQLYYGYPRSSDGFFRRFVVKYSPATDSVTVRQFTADEESRGSVDTE